MIHTPRICIGTVVWHDAWHKITNTIAVCVTIFFLTIHQMPSTSQQSTEEEHHPLLAFLNRPPASFSDHNLCCVSDGCCSIKWASINNSDFVVGNYPVGLQLPIKKWTDPMWMDLSTEHLDTTRWLRSSTNWWAMIDSQLLIHQTAGRQQQ